MPSFETLADIFTRLSVFDSPKGSSNIFNTHKNISLYFQRRHLIIYNYQCFWDEKNTNTYVLWEYDFYKSIIAELNKMFC